MEPVVASLLASRYASLFGNDSSLISVSTLAQSYFHRVFRLSSSKTGTSSFAKVMRDEGDLRWRLANQTAGIQFVGDAVTPQLVKPDDGDKAASTAAAADSGELFSEIMVDGERFFVLVFQLLDGWTTVYSAVNRASSAPLPLLGEYGRVVGAMSKRLLSFKGQTNAGVPPSCFAEAGLSTSAASLCPVPFSPSSWDLRRALMLVDASAEIADPVVRGLVRKAQAEFAARVLPLYGDKDCEKDDNANAKRALEAAPLSSSSTSASASSMLRASWVHADANDFNVLCCHSPSDSSHGDTTTNEWALRVIDWDDFCFSYLAHEPAVALTYLMMDRASPIDTACAFLRHYCEQCPLTETEVRAMLSLIKGRLAVSLCQSALSSKKALAEGDEARSGYILVHAKPASRLLAFLSGASPADTAGCLCEGWEGVHTSLPYDEEVAISRLLAACGLLQPPRGPQSYKHGPVLSEGQKALSIGVLKALDWLAASADQLQPVADAMTQPLPDGVADATTSNSERKDGKVGWIPSLPSLSAAAAVGKEGWWKVAPFIYNFTASASAGASDAGGGPTLADVVGAGDPAKLDAFVRMMFEPLALGSGSGGALRVGWGRYAENRVIYTSEHFTNPSASESASARTLHIGVDLELPTGTPIKAPLPGTIHSFARNGEDLDYGPTIILKHELEVTVETASSSSSSSSVVVSLPFFTLYGHLSLSSILKEDGGGWRLSKGQKIEAGEVLGWVGGPHVNGGWPPHLHFQVNTEIEHGGWQGDYPGVTSLKDFLSDGPYSLLCPDPNVLLRCPFVEPLGSWGGNTKLKEGEGSEEVTLPLFAEDGKGLKGMVKGRIVSVVAK